MADVKKEKPAWNFDFIEGAIVWIFLLALVGSLATMLTHFVTSGELTFYGYRLSGVWDFFKSNVEFFKILGFVITGFAAYGTFKFTRGADAIWREEKAKVFPDNMPAISFSEISAPNPMQTRWEKIIKLSESENSSEWRLSVIEADIILDELLEKLQLPGDTMGDKLKAVEKSDFTTIESAWEAHKARNAIAHEGSEFLINQREIRRIISLYESVFKEFELI